MVDVSRNQPVYNISVAAELVGVHPRTLRIYEETGLIIPARTEGNTRLFSNADIEAVAAYPFSNSGNGIKSGWGQTDSHGGRKIEYPH